MCSASILYCYGALYVTAPGEAGLICLLCFLSAQSKQQQSRGSNSVMDAANVHQCISMQACVL